MVGSIFLAEVIFTDHSGSKLRPIIVIKEYSKDVYFLPLTTNLTVPGVKISSDDLEEGKIRQNSMVAVKKLCIIDKSLLLKKIGKIRRDKFELILDELCKEICGG